MTKKALAILILAAAGALLVWTTAGRPDPGPPDLQQAGEPEAPRVDLAKATFAGGCFWCMEPPFDKLDGVISTTSGYIGGHKDNPTYKQVTSGGTGHYEVTGSLAPSSPRT